MFKIGITGQKGFIGTYLTNFLTLKKDDVTLIPFEDESFSDVSKLKEFVSDCDVIVHLAAVNRHADPEFIYDTNIDLVKRLIDVLQAQRVHPHVIFSSSTQEERDNPFGRSKRVGRDMLYKWACESGSPFTGMIIPNVFGPFGNPYYNSVVATFSYQLTHNETPKIDTDALLKMIYVDDLAEAVFNIIKNRVSNDELRVKHTTEISVKEILSLLASFQSLYVEKGIIPDIRNRFERDLFNTFVTYLDIETHFPVKLNQSIDSRGSFVETAKITSGGQISFSTTKPGITRGNHFHTRKAERFAVIKGKALIQLRRIGNDKVISFELDGSLPAYVDMPIWYTHNITNIGDNELFTIFWISEFFDPKDPDTYFETV